MKKISDEAALKAVGWVFLVFGVATVVMFIMGIIWNHLLNPMNALGIGVFYGLRARQNLWRVVGMVLVLIPLVILPLGAVLAMAQPAQVYPILLFGFPVAKAALPVFVLWVTGFWLLGLWQFTVLNSPEVRAMFKRVA